MKMQLFRSTAAATIAVAAFILCYSAHASTRSTAGTPWDMLQAQLDEGGTVTLTNDVTATSGDATLTVTNAVTLDLNGHTIAFNGSKEVFHVGTGGDLTLTNGLAAGVVTGGGDHGVYIGSNAVFRLQGGAIAGNVSGYGGGGVFVNAFGTFEMSGGAITNNAVYDGDEAGGGVFVVEDGTFTMTGGTISGNAALRAGGVEVRGTFAMSGGEISSNTARTGGGVSVDWDGAFTMSGGEISSNTATNYGGGVLVDMSDSFTVSGSAFVSGNARPDGSANNVYTYCATITVSNLTADASIGVTTDTEPTASEPITFATGATAADASRFTSDHPAFAVDFTDGELRLIKRTTPWDRLQAQLDAGGVVTLTNDVTATSVDWTLTVTNAVTLDLNGHVIDAAGYFGVIQIFDGGNLTLTNGTESAGTITGGATDLGGGVEVYGTFTMAGGEISGNTASVGGGVGVGWGGAFTMTGGTISDNSANWAGGVEAYGTFTMSGGTISGNVADDGGGVYVDGAFTVSGSPTVYGNTNSVGTANNVYLPNGCSIAVDSLSADASIGVTTEDAPAVYSPVAFATGAAAGDEARFFGDDPALVVDNENGELRLRPLMTWGLLQALLDAGGTVTLTDDMVATNGDASLSVTNAVTLDLNGHSITHNGNGCVINVRSGGDLTLTNSLAAGVVTGGSGGVYIYGGGTFTMTGGTISGNTTKDGGGVYVDSYGTFIISGGEISGNTATSRGGGVYVRFYSSFTMSGGTISGNSASRSGGGVYVCEDVTFTMSGGEITGNAAPEGGGASMYCRSIEISGSPVVSGNTNSFGAANNVYLWARTFHSSGLSAGTRIGVNTYDTPTLSSPVTIASGTSADDGAYFFSDDPAFAVSATTGVMYLVRVPTAWDLLQAQLNEGGTVTLASNVTATARDATLKVSNAVTLDLNGHTIDAAGHFGVIEVCAGGDLTLTNSVEGAGAITGGGNAYEGAGVEVRAGGVFTMTGGAISGNSSTYASGVDVNGTFTMTGGTISGNMADSGGGGVYVCWGYFTMTGGTISGNAAGDEGGGVYMYDGTFTVSGSPVVSDNTNSVGEAKNVYLKDWFLENGYAIAVSNLTAGAHIGVKTETAPTLSNPVTFATDASAGDAACFFSDVFGYEVELDGSDLRLVGELPQGFKDPEGREIEDYGVVDWLSNNGFTQADIDALGHDSAATDRLYADITVSNRVSMTVQLVRKAPLAGWINGTLLIYGVNDLAAGFGSSPIPDESVEYFTGDPTFNLVTASNDTVTQTAVATLNSSVTAKFFKAEFGIFIPYEPEEPWEPEPEPEPEPDPEE